MEQTVLKAVKRIEALRESILDIPEASKRTRAQDLNWYMTTARIDELKDFFNIADPISEVVGIAGTHLEEEIDELEKELFNIQMQLKKKRNAYYAKTHRYKNEQKGC